MNTDEQYTDVTIAGAGPVGLYLAGLLGIMDFSVTVLEPKPEVDLHSKSLGIHPVSLELFDEVNIAAQFVDAGLPIKKGLAFIDRKEIGAVTFEPCPEPFNYILALPQYRTEQILETWCNGIANVTILRGAKVTEFEQTEEAVFTRYESAGENEVIRSLYLAGCDGKKSLVREAAGIEFSDKPYPDTYIMGDFSDNTPFGPDAAVYLHRDGLIESFPLPDSTRRWVVKTDHYVEKPTRELIEQLIDMRIGHPLAGQQNLMLSSFGVQHHLAESFHSGRVVLAGDSAHVVSPIGGQGMNLGWLTAKRLADTLKAIRDEPGESEGLMRNFSKISRSVARTVAKRAEINMWLGRKRRFPILRNGIARLIVNTPLQKIMARIFTMRGI